MVTRREVRAIGLLSGPAIFALLLLVPIPSLPSFQAKVVLVAALWMGTWWITEAIPIYATSLLPLALFPLFGVTSLSGLSSSNADRAVFLFLGGFVLAAAIERPDFTSGSPSTLLGSSG